MKEKKVSKLSIIFFIIAILIVVIVNGYFFYAFLDARADFMVPIPEGETDTRGLVIVTLFAVFLVVATIANAVATGFHILGFVVSLRKEMRRHPFTWVQCGFILFPAICEVIVGALILSLNGVVNG